MKSPEKKIERLIEKHRRIMHMKHLDYGTAQKHYGIFKGLNMALDILRESAVRLQSDQIYFKNIKVEKNHKMNKSCDCGRAWIIYEPTGEDQYFGKAVNTTITDSGFTKSCICKYCGCIYDSFDPCMVVEYETESREPESNNN